MVDSFNQPPAHDEIRARIEAISPHLGVFAVLPTLENLAPYTSYQSKEIIGGTLNKLFPGEAWQQYDFDLLRELSERRGPFIEIGGPSPQGYNTVNLTDVYKRTGKRILATNHKRSELQKGLPKDLNEAVEIGGLVDAHDLPFSPNSIGALLTSGLGYFATPQLFEQAPSVLETRGIVIAEYLNNLDVALAIKAGLDLRSYSSQIYTWPGNFSERIWFSVFQKPADK